MTDASSKPSKRRRRWFQFSLRTLLIVVTLVAGLLAAWRVYVEPYRRQREAMKLTALMLHGTGVTDTGLKNHWTSTGDEEILNAA